MLIRLLGALVAVALPLAARAQMQVTAHLPALNATAPVGTAIAFTFDRPLDPASVTDDSFRAYGQWSGPARGTFTLSNGNQTVTLTPDAPFSAGEVVSVHLSHDLRGADLTPLRAAAYAFQFWTATAATAATFSEIDRFRNTAGPQTRIYGAAAADLNDDGYLDLATINEVSADVRVFLNLADGSGLFGPMLPPQGIGVEASPNAPADFDNDGRIDLCVAAASSEEVSILLGAGDGTFASIVDIPIGGGSQPHGIAPLDVDGDGDLDVVNANVGANNLSLLTNDGSGTFSGPTFFEGGVDGEYGLTAADMNGDGITDLVVAGRNGSELTTMLGNGDGTFTAAGPPRPTGGSTWVVVVGDVDGDGVLDAATANDGSGNVGILRGNGDGTFAPAVTIPIGSHVPAVDLGDLDGDGDLDLVVSSFGGQFWRIYRNDGSGVFAFESEIAATDNPSCAVLFDFDNDHDLDLALTDEIEDEIILLRNGDAPPSCSTLPRTCRQSTAAGKSALVLKDATPGSAGAADTLIWKLTRGEATAKADFGDPLADDAYALCIYENEALVRALAAPAGVTRWKASAKGYAYRDAGGAPDGVLSVKLKEGLVDGKTTLKLKAKGANLGVPDPSTLTGTLDVQLQRTDGTVCWGARYSPPFKQATSTLLKAASDAPLPPTTLPASWFAIHTQVVAAACSGCHGGSGGLSGLNDCHTGHAALVGIASTELPSMPRVTAGDASLSWFMHKLDGTHSGFTAQCSGGFCGQSMPLGGGLLSLDVRNAIRTWIDNGAVNDCW